MDIPIHGIFKCPMIFKDKHPEIDWCFCLEYYMCYNGDSNKPEQGFYCDYEVDKE